MAKYKKVMPKILVIKANGMVFEGSFVSSAMNVFSCQPPYVHNIGINARPNDASKPLFMRSSDIQSLELHMGDVSTKESEGLPQKRYKTPKRKMDLKRASRSDRQ